MKQVKLSDVSPDAVAPQTAASTAGSQVQAIVQQIELGKILSKAFDALTGNFVSFAIVGIAALLPFAVLEYWMLGGFGQSDILANMPEWSFFAIYMAAVMILNMVAEAAIIVGTAEYQAGRKAGIITIVGKSFTYLLPVLAASVIVTLLTMAGYLMLVIPGVIVSLALSIVIPVIVVEGLGPIDAMKRSVELTDGNRSAIFGLLIVINIMTSVFSWAVEFIGSIITGGDTVSLVSSGFSLLGMGITAALAGAIYATLYASLREIKEGTSADEIARVFA